MKPDDPINLMLSIIIAKSDSDRILKIILMKNNWSLYVNEDDNLTNKSCVYFCLLLLIINQYKMLFSI